MFNYFAEARNIIIGSNKQLTVFNGNYEDGEKICEKLKILTSSELGAIVLCYNGVIVDNWIRLFGQDTPEINGVLHYNNKEFEHNEKLSGMFIVACDVLGGLYAINVKRFQNDRHKVWYYAPISPKWKCLDMSYKDFLTWIFHGDTDSFYLLMRWHNWQNDTKNIDMNSGIRIYPPLHAKVCDLEKASKKIEKIDDIIEMNLGY